MRASKRMRPPPSNRLNRQNRHSHYSQSDARPTETSIPPRVEKEGSETRPSSGGSQIDRKPWRLSLRVDPQFRSDHNVHPGRTGSTRRDYFMKPLVVST